MANSLSIGDILQFACQGGVAYVTYAGKNDSLGDAIWVAARVFPGPTEDWREVFSEPGYFTFYPAHTAVKRKLVQKVGYSTDAIRFLPSKRRSAVSIDKNGKVTSWLITEGASRTHRRDDELNEDERQLPIADIWNHQYLIDAIATGWMPK
jgi:hypothetical protein